MSVHECSAALSNLPFTTRTLVWKEFVVKPDVDIVNGNAIVVTGLVEQWLEK